jgi:hypothetical protein
MCDSSSTSSGENVYLDGRKKSNYTTDATDSWHWVIETHVSDSNMTGLSRHYYINDERQSWIYNQILVYRKWHGASPKYNEKLIKANFMKSMQNRRKEIPKRIYIRDFAQAWGIQR